MMYVEREDGEDVYYIYTNVGNLLILVTKDCKLAMQTNAALKNKKNDSDFRIKAVRDKRKAACGIPPEPRTVPPYDLDGIAVRIPVSTIPDQGRIFTRLVRW